MAAYVAESPIHAAERNPRLAPRLVGRHALPQIVLNQQVGVEPPFLLQAVLQFTGAEKLTREIKDWLSNGNS